MKTKTIQFTKDKETKGAIRFAEIADGEMVVGSLYIRKEFLGQMRPLPMDAAVQIKLEIRDKDTDKFSK